MFEKQKANGDQHEPKVQISEELQSEFEQKHATQKTDKTQIKSLLAFANEQIKKQCLEIQRLKQKLPESEVAAEKGTKED